MTTTTNAPKPSKPPLVRALEVIAVLGVTLLLMACAGIAFPLQGIFYLAVGWVAYLRRTAPRLELNWPAVATAAACLVAFGLGGHWFLSWSYANRTRESDESTRRWRVTWTSGIAAAVLLSFIAGICVIGLAHQMAWLMRSEQPILESTPEFVFRVQSHNILKQIGRGVIGYEREHAVLPEAATFNERGRPLHSWQTRVLPFIGYKVLYDEINLSRPWDARENRNVFVQRVPEYVHQKDWSQHDSEYAITSYAGNAWLLGGSRRWRTAEITDGTSTTVLCGEATTQPRAWGDPVNWRDPAAGIAHTPAGFGGAFHGVTLFAFADGHATTLSNQIDPAVFRALCTPAAGDKIKEANGDENEIIEP